VSIFTSCIITPSIHSSPLTLSPTPTFIATPKPIPTSVFSTFPILSPTNASHIQEIARFSKGIVQQTIWFPDNKHIAVSTTVGVYIYDVTTGKELSYFETGASPHIALSSDGKLLAAGAGTSIWLWDVETGQEKYKLEIAGKRVERVVISP